ncbi:MAG: hypothetical protein QOI05_1482 [Bradyrhizobium sp.]|nr:hypothetical protein [Bradyrhizobium sp.]
MSTVQSPAIMSSTIHRNSGLFDRVSCRLAETEADREEIYRLRYRAYVLEGAIAPRDEQRLTDKFDTLPNSWLFGLYVDGALASSIRISVASKEQPLTPAVETFGDLLEPEVAQGKVIVDPNRFVADPDNRSKIPELPYLTVRLGYVACAHFDADIGTATVRAEHRAFYRRVFLLEPRCMPRPYPTLLKPLCLMAADADAVREKIFQRYPYFRSTPAEREALFGRSNATACEATRSPP